MPLYVDHVGLNTLVNQEIDIQNNILLTGSTREVPAGSKQIGRSINSPNTGVNRTQYLYTTMEDSIDPNNFGDKTAGYFNTSSTAQNGMSYSFWANIKGGTEGTSQKFILAQHHTTTSEPIENVSTADQSFHIQFRFEQLHITAFSSTGSGERRWRWSYASSDYGDWDHWYINWSGSFAIAPAVYLNGVEQSIIGLDGAATSPSTLLKGTKQIFLFDHPLNDRTGYELQGRLQNFAIYNSQSGPAEWGTTGVNRLDQLYNDNVALGANDTLPDEANLVAFWPLGSEPELSDHNVGDNIMSSFQATKGNRKAQLIPKSQDLILSEGKTIFNPSAGELVGHVGKVSEETGLVALNTHRNGPYGYSSWTQTRSSRNPISRHYRSNNTMTFVLNPGPIGNILSEGEQRIRARYSPLKRFDEPVVTQRSYPLVWNVGRHFKDEETGLVDMDNPHKFSILSSYGNQLIGFANDEVDRLLRFEPNEDNTEYTSIKEMYLDNGLDKLDSPLTHWEFLYSRETVFPILKNQYRKLVRTRPQFESFYRHNRRDRSKRLISGSNAPFGFPENSNGFEQSTWPLDASENFLTNQKVSPFNLEYALGSSTIQGRNSRKYGILMSSETTFHNSLALYNVDIQSLDLVVQSSGSNIIDNNLAPYPIYARRHTLYNTSSVVSPCGMSIPETGSSTFYNVLFEGEALWEAGSKRQVLDEDGNYISSPKQPFYDTYENYVDDIRRKGKNYSVIPEFRMSTQLEDYIRTDGNIELDMFEVTGGILGIEDSSKESFFEVYSMTDFLRNFEIIDHDHEDFINGNVVALRCKAIKKFLPYEGFYPCQRTAQMAEQFYKSYAAHVGAVAGATTDNEKPLPDLNYANGLLMTPLFAPGVLFNTIKSGVAVDYPIVTGSLYTTTSYGHPSTIPIGGKFLR